MLSQHHDSLYHYTNESGLYGILDSQSIWTTHAKHLNDITELAHFRELAFKLLSHPISEFYKEFLQENSKFKNKIDESGGIDKFIRHESNAIVNALYKATGDNFYIASFCGKHIDNYINDNGLLSQWRGYGGKQGIAIEFDTVGLEKLLKVECQEFAYDKLFVGDVVYSNNEIMLQKYLSPCFQPIIDFCISTLNELIYKKPRSGANDAMSGFVQCITSYKHRGFEEEREVRIVGWVRNKETQEYIEKEGGEVKSLKPIRSRSGIISPIPYIALFEQDNISLPIKRIIIGPHENKKVFAEKLSKKINGTGIKISVSDIPYVNFYLSS